MLRFEPTEKELKITTKKGTQRLIFHAPIELDEKEEEEMAKFRDFVKKAGKEIPDGFDNDSRLLLRILQGSKFKYDHCLEQLDPIAKFYKETFPMPREKYEPLINNGFLYITGRDKKFRPVFILDLARFMELKTDVELSCNVVLFLMDFAIRRCMLPSKVENVCMIVNLANVSITSMPVKRI